jgi:hypothetical protein
MPHLRLADEPLYGECQGYMCPPLEGTQAIWFKLRGHTRVPDDGSSPRVAPWLVLVFPVDCFPYCKLFPTTAIRAFRQLV